VHIQQKYFEAKGIRNTGIRWAAQVVEKLWDITWKYWGMRSAWTHSDKSLCYKMECLSLKQDITREYKRGPEGGRGLAARWWNESLRDLLDMRVQDQER